MVSAALLLPGCAGSGGGTDTGTAQGINPLFPIQQSALQQDTTPQTPAQQNPVPQTPATQAADNVSAYYIGTWVHTYEYFDVTYRTTLVIDANGTAVYYNDEAELGNFSATWQLNGSSLYVSRSDGIQSTLTLNGSTLIETSYEDGQTYQAEYYRA